MVRRIKKFLVTPAFLLFCSCGTTESFTAGKNEWVPDRSVKHSKLFAVARKGDATSLYLKGKRYADDTTAVFVLYNGIKPEYVTGTARVYFIKKPCRNIASLSSVYTQMLFELNKLDVVKAIDNIDYVNNPAILKKCEEEELPELARTPNIEVEQTIALAPDVVFFYGMGDGRAPDRRIEKAGIPVVESVDHLEETPLARAEWIKFFAEFVGRRSLADSIFAVCEEKYELLKWRVEELDKKPTVFNEIKYSDAWYMPGGKSYVARLLKDAGARYLWEDNDEAGSLPLSFEAVFAKAKMADYWIHLSTVRSKKELLSYERRYAAFKAFKTGNLYNNTKVTNTKGYSTYWESGMVHPERILEDLVKIFHPEIADSLQEELFYYEQIR